MIDRYSVVQINEIFSDKSKFEKWLLVEKKVLKFLSNKGHFSNKKYEQIVEKLSVNPLEVYLEEKKTKHDFVAFLNVISSKVDLIEKKWIHYGLTSSDVVDTSLSLMLKEANEIILDKLKELQKTLKNLSLKYKDLVQVGRTHGMHAEITSFGYKFALYYDDLKRQIKSFYWLRRYIECVMVSGSVGIYSNTSLELQDFLVKELGLYNSTGSTQVLSRERYASYFAILNIMGQTINKIATELRNLSRTEIGEISEKFEKGQVGSSSMPHKKNPVVLENICGLSRLLKGYALNSLDNIPLWHERDISHSSVERVVFLDALSIFYNIVQKLNQCLNTMEVNEEQINKNILLTRDNIFSQKALLTLIPKVNISRDKLHQEISNISQKSYENNSSFREELRNSKLSKELSDEEFDGIFSIKNSLKNINNVYNRIFEREKFHHHFETIYWNKEEILNAIYKLSDTLNREYEDSGDDVVLINLIEGSTVFLGHLMINLTFSLIMTSIRLSFYHDSTTISDKAIFNSLKEVDLSICKGRDVVIFDDLIDTGKTISVLKEHIETFKPKSIKVCVLFKKLNNENLKVKIDWSGLDIPNFWVAGFGLDSKKHYRNLDFIGALKDEYKV